MKVTNRSFVSYAGNDHNLVLKTLQAKFPAATFNSIPFDGRQMVTVPATTATNAQVRSAVSKFRGHMMPSY